MKRVVEKVKDIVEICPFTYLHDFAADPGLTLAGYHFTDITADLMSNWIERVSAVKAGEGSAFALAGFRGVGKSHFLSVLGAIIARPELRSRISDPHVASTAERLSRRHGQVAIVKRGSGSSLVDELKKAVGGILETNPSNLSDSLYDLLLSASEQTGDVPLVLLIDTAMGRDARVARDDGAVLSQIAEAAKSIGVFVGVALDDDISGADGPNASISANFSIDYLDQEHLYKIVDSVIFSKHNQKRGVLHEIYDDYRTEMPGFRWSEQRFASLYPLHPATVEIAPLIRLYVQDFALLGFAAEAGVKILGRPANSLIGLDEVFDSVEPKLRSSGELEAAFEAFDEIEREVISKIPVGFRHPAKLILKGLLMLSLGGEGATGAEVGASMMILDSTAADGSVFSVEALLESFAAALPKSIDRSAREGASPKFSFRLASSVKAEINLSDAVAKVPDNAIWRILLGHVAEKFSDFVAADDLTLFSVEWRGGIRRGEMIWPPNDNDETPQRERRDQADWTIRVEPDADDTTPDEETGAIRWKLPKLTEQERETVSRLYLLHNDAGVRESYGDGLSTALHLCSIAVEKIWTRVFLTDARLTVGGSTYGMGESAATAHSLSQLFSSSLRPIFDALYPAHPHFAETFGLKQAATLISGFLSGSETNNADAQKLAETFALPLGLAVAGGDMLTASPPEVLLELACVKAALVGSDPDAMIPRKEIALRLQAAPFGFTREAQHVTLAALVSQRQFEFVTSSGNRINHRSLDLQIIWDDIVGVAKPLNETFSADRLLAWAKLITGNAGLRSIDAAEDRSLIVDSLGGWLTGWKQSRALAEFDELPDEHLNASIWRTAANLRKSFGAMADIIDSLVKNDLSLDQCLQMVADLFSDSQAEFENKKSDLRVLRDYTSGVKKRGEIATYLTLCEYTGVAELEEARAALLEGFEVRRFDAVAGSGERLVANWNNFKTAYSDHYGRYHDLVMRSADSSEKLKSIIRSDAWAAFESFSSVSWLLTQDFARAKSMIRELRQLHCDAKIADTLTNRPFCGCSFSLAESDRLIGLAAELELTVQNGIDGYSRAILKNQEQILETAASDAMRTSISTILAGLSSGIPLDDLASQDLRILKIAVDQVGIVSPAAIARPKAEPIPDEMHLWENEVQKVEEFVNSEI